MTVDQALGIHVLGPFQLQHLVSHVVEDPMKFDEDIVKAAAKHWEAALLERPKMFDGPVWCVRKLEVKGPELHLELQRSSFKYVLYTHLSQEGHALPPSKRFGACGLMALTETADGLLLFGKRSQQLSCLPGYWHCVPAGQVDNVNFGSVLQHELLEETGVDWQQVSSSHLLAVADAGREQGHKFEFIFYLKLSLTAQQVYDRYTAALDKMEHEAIAFVGLPGAELTGASVEGAQEVSFDAFLAGGTEGFLVTDVARRALHLLQQRAASKAE